MTVGQRLTEARKPRPSGELLAKFAELYGVSIDWLVTGQTTTVEGLDAKLDRCDPADRAAIVRLVSTLATKGKKE